MSSVSTRNKANVVESVAIPAGAIVVGACLVGLAKGLSFVASAALQAARESAAINTPEAIRSVSALRAETKLLDLAVLPTGDLETLKSEALTRIASQPFLVPDSARLKQSVAKLDNAKSIDEFKTAHRDLVEKLETGHQQIFSNAVLEAGKRAALKIGFDKIEILPTLRQSVIRFAATDQAGRTIVTEINASKDRDVRIETEVVGVSDGSCNEILDNFDQALEDEGVRSHTPIRKFTGGVCELAAVRDFLKKNPQKNPNAETNDNAKEFAPASDAKRRRRLNRKNQTRNRR